MLFKRPFMYNFNDDAKKFFLKNGITEEDFSKIDMDLRRILESSHFDSVVESVAIYDDSKKKEVFIGDILGYDYPKSNDIFLSIGEFFDSNGDKYQARSVEMLEIDSDELLSKLESSFVIEPMRIKEINDNQYLIDGNGMHRFTVFKLHYIIDKYRGKSEEELRQKYTIPVMSRKLDKVKTYLAYLIKILDDKITVKKHIDEEFRYTGKVLIREEDGTKRVLTDEEFIIYTLELIAKYGMDVPNLFRLLNHVERNALFSEFLKSYFGDLMSEVERFREYKESCIDQEEVYMFKSNLVGREKQNQWNL